MDFSFVSIDLPMIEKEYNNQMASKQEGILSETNNTNTSEYEINVSLELSRDENTIQQELQENNQQRNFEKEASELLVYVKELLGRNEEQQALIEGLKQDLEKEQTRKILNDVNSCVRHKKAVSRLIDDSLRKDKEILQYKTIFALLRNAKTEEEAQTILRDFDESGKKEHRSPNMNAKSPKSVTPSRYSSPKSPPTDTSPNTKIIELRKQLATSSSRNKKLQQEVEKWKNLASSYEKMFGIVKVSVSLPNENNETND